MKKTVVNKLFVYGTLGPGRPNEHILKNIGGAWQEGIVKGRLYEKGWGAAMGYPGITLEEEGERIKGFLFTSDNLTNHWKMLDEFEGTAYKRIVATVQLQDGTETRAYIYALSS